jgi:hypothetical protein
VDGAARAHDIDGTCELNLAAHPVRYSCVRVNGDSCHQVVDRPNGQPALRRHGSTPAQPSHIDRRLTAIPLRSIPLHPVAPRLVRLTHPAHISAVRSFPTLPSVAPYSAVGAIYLIKQV